MEPLHRPQDASPKQSHKTCTRCKLTKPLSEYGTKGAGRIRSECKACKHIYDAAYRTNHKKHAAEYAKTWREEHPDYWRKRPIYPRRPRSRAAYNRVWRSNNRERVAQYRRTKRARKFANGWAVTVAQWREIQRLFRGRCAYCKRQTILTQDHVIPLALGGEHVAANIVPACRSCNSRKHTKTPESPAQLAIVL